MGRLHTNYNLYNTGGGVARVPADRRVKAYTEGYAAQKKGQIQTTNPLPAWQNTDPHSDWSAWDRGWQDANAGFPNTFTGA